MSLFLALDFLLIVLICMFAPIGFWRGPVKELFVLLGILFGVILSDYWARPWGGDLSDVTSLNPDAGAFVVAMIFLISATFVIGYGIGAALAPADMLPETRGLGAVIAAFNGMLLLSFSLQFVRLFLLSDANEESLQDSFVASFLLNDIGWVLMVAAILAVPLILYLLLSGRRAYEPSDAYPYGPADPMSAAIAAAAQRQQPWRAHEQPHAQTLPPRVPGPPRGEPVERYKAEPQRPATPPLSEMREVRVDSPGVTAEPARQHNAPHDSMQDTDPHLVITPVTTPADQQASAAAQAAAPSDLAPGYVRCRTCRAVLAPDTTVCPNCGTAR
ncbi:MAG: hypothetical protein DCC58_14765 [Chloroflexi bacterium]|nr:MAG: hypothetical protein DCC58_14765 [Chloroflexota bacterium]